MPQHYVGLDASLDQTSLCVLDVTGRIIREAKLGMDPDAVAGYLERAALATDRFGLETDPLSPWLHAGLAAHGLPAVCIETRHTKAALGAKLVKTNRGDARGSAQLMRTGWFKAVHVKTQRAQDWCLLLTQRRLLVNKLIDVAAGGPRHALGLRPKLGTRRARRDRGTCASG